MFKRDKGQSVPPPSGFKESAPTEPEKVKPAKPVKKGGGEKRPNIFKRIGRYFKEMWSELKKVTWPSAVKVLKQTAIVLVVVAIFLLVLLGIDSLLGYLLGLLVGAGA